jgi:hypothetical protein
MKIRFRQPRLSKAHRLFAHSHQPKQKQKHSEHKLTFACARALISAEAFITSTSHVLFMLRNAPTSGASALRFHCDA